MNRRYKTDHNTLLEGQPLLVSTKHIKIHLLDNHFNYFLIILSKHPSIEGLKPFITIILTNLLNKITYKISFD